LVPFRDAALRNCSAISVGTALDRAGTITGNLTLHGTTKPVTLDVVLNKVGQNPLDKKTPALEVEAAYRRSEALEKRRKLMGCVGVLL
jgi:hypothetical protein